VIHSSVVGVRVGVVLVPALVAQLSLNGAHPVIDAHAPVSHDTCLYKLVLVILHHCRSSFLWHHMNGAHPFAIKDRVEDPCIKKFKNFFFHYLFKVWVESSLVLYRWLVKVLQQNSMRADSRVDPFRSLIEYPIAPL
jgi:hypothetical protein